MTTSISALEALRQRLSVAVAVRLGAAYPLESEPISKVVAGEFHDGLQASLSDDGDLIEFGLTRRYDGQFNNVLHVSIDVTAEPFNVVCSSDEFDDLNYERDAQSSDDPAISLPLTRMVSLI